MVIFNQSRTRFTVVKARTTALLLRTSSCRAAKAPSASTLAFASPSFPWSPSLLMADLPVSTSCQISNLKRKAK